MKKSPSEEKKEILRTLRKQLKTDTIESLGSNRYSTRERYQDQLEDGTVVFLKKCKLFDGAGNQIPLVNAYNWITRYTKKVAVVRMTENVKILNGNTGLKAHEETKEGLIDVDGRELLPCIYDSINVKLDGFVEISKAGKKKATRVNKIINGEFDWDEAMDWS